VQCCYCHCCNAETTRRLSGLALAKEEEIQCGTIGGKSKTKITKGIIESRLIMAEIYQI